MLCEGDVRKMSDNVDLRKGQKLHKGEVGQVGEVKFDMRRWGSLTVGKLKRWEMWRVTGDGEVGEVGYVGMGTEEVERSGRWQRLWGSRGGWGGGGRRRGGEEVGEVEKSGKSGMSFLVQTWLMDSRGGGRSVCLAKCRSGS